MNTNGAIVRHDARENQHKPDLVDLWDDEGDSHEYWLANKRDDIAIVLTGMLEDRSMSFADLARALNWKPSRVSRALSGRENLTVNTIAEIVGAADYDFDILIRPKSARRAYQPWEEQQMGCELFERLLICENLVEEVRAMHETAVSVVEHSLRNRMRQNQYVAPAEQTDAANEDYHDELFDNVAA